MAKFNFLKNSFRTGQISKKFFSRANTDEYQNACEDLSNLLPLKDSGLTTRPGTLHLKNLSNDSVIIPFNITGDDSLLVCLPIFPNEDLAYDSSSDFFLWEPFIVESDGSVQTMSVEPFPNRIFDDGYYINKVRDLDRCGYQYAQIGDVLVVVHSSGDMAPLVIKRITDPRDGVLRFFWGSFHERFLLNALNPINGLTYPFEIVTEQEEWLEVTTSSIPGRFNGTFYSDVGNPRTKKRKIKDTDVGSAIRWTSSGKEVIFVIEGLLDDGSQGYAKESAVVLLRRLTLDNVLFDRDDVGNKKWALSQWSERLGWPRSVAAYEQRLFFGGSPSYPDVLWASEAGDIYHFLEERLLQDIAVIPPNTAAINVTGMYYFGETKATDPFQFAIYSKNYPYITWLASTNVLHIGTLGSEFILTGGESGLSRTDITVFPSSHYGSSAVQPVTMGLDTFFVGKSNNTLMSIQTEPVELRSRVVNYSLLNPDIISETSNSDGAGLAEFCKIQGASTLDTVYGLNEYGDLVTFGSDPELKFNAWSKHNYENGPDNKVLDIATTINDSNSGEFLWTVNSFLGFIINTGVTTNPVISSAEPFITTALVAPDRGGRALYIDKTTTFNDLDLKFISIFVVSIKDDDVAKQRYNIIFKNNLADPDPVGAGINVSIDLSSIETDNLQSLIEEIQTTVNSIFELGVLVPSHQYSDPLFSENPSPPAPPAPPLPGKSLRNIYNATAKVGNKGFRSGFSIGTGRARYIFGFTPDTTPSDLNSKFFLARAVGYTLYMFWFNVDGTGTLPSATNFTTPEALWNTEPIEAKLEIKISSLDTTQQITEKTINAINAAFEDDDGEFFNIFKASNGLETCSTEVIHLDRSGAPFSAAVTNPTGNLKESSFPIFTDSSLIKTAPDEAPFVYEFPHLLNKTIHLLGDGFYLGEFQTDTSGKISLDKSFDVVIGGLYQNRTMKTVPLEIGGDFGSSIGLKQRVDSIVLMLYRTFGPVAGYAVEDLFDLELIPSGQTVTGLQAGLPLFTGRYQMDMPASPEDEQFVIVEQRKPLPFTITGIAFRGKTNDSSS